MEGQETVFVIMRDILDDPGNYVWVTQRGDVLQWDTLVTIELEPNFIATPQGRAAYWVSIKQLSNVLHQYPPGSSFCVTSMRRADGSARMRLYVSHPRPAPPGGGDQEA